jgi:hypothetical protein
VSALTDPTEHKGTLVHKGKWRLGSTCHDCEAAFKALRREKWKKGPTTIPPYGFASTNPNMEEFWVTGDPAVFDKPKDDE